MLFDNLAACFGPLVPEDLRNIWTTQGERFCRRHTGPNSRTCADLHAARWKRARLIDSDNTNTIRPLGPYTLSMNRKIAPLACRSDPEAQLPLDATHENLSLKRKDCGLFLDDFPGAKKRRTTPKSPRNSTDGYSSAHNENDVDRVEIIKEPTNPMDNLLIKRRGNVRFQLPKAEMKVAQAKRPLIDFPGQKGIGRTLPVYNSAFAMTGSLPRVNDPLWFSQLPDDCSWDTSDGNEDSCQSTLVPTPSGSIDYNSPGKTGIWVQDYDCDCPSTPARLPPTLLLNPATVVPMSDSEKPKPRRAIESEDSSDINSGSDAYSGSEEEEEEEEQSWMTMINSEEEVERQLEVISEYGSYRKAFVYKRRSASVARYPNVMKANDSRAVDVSRGIQPRIRDRSPGEFIHSLSRCSEDGTSNSRLLKVSIKTLLEIGSGSFEGTLLKPKMAYRGKEISFLRHV